MPPPSSNKCLIFKYFSLFLISSLFLLSSDAFAFGGGGHGRISQHYKQGVASYGIHFGGDGDVNIDIRDCDDQTETWIGTQCCPNNLIYTENDSEKCCNEEGYEFLNGVCQKQCATGLALVGGECKNLCADYQPTTCAQGCDPKTGFGIPEPTTTVCGNNMHCSGTDDSCICDDTFVPHDQYSCACPDGWTGELCDIKVCDASYDLAEDQLDTTAYIYDECIDTQKHYKKAGCTNTHISHQGSCVSCTDSLNQIETTEAECDLCPNRAWNEETFTCDLAGGQGETCTRNVDCHHGLYCYSTRTYDSTTQRYIDNGTCQEINISHTYNTAYGTFTHFGGYNSGYTTYTQAWNWCHAQKGQLMARDEWDGFCSYLYCIRSSGTGDGTAWYEKGYIENNEDQRISGVALDDGQEVSWIANRQALCKISNADLCADYVATPCAPTCDPETGAGILLAEGTRCVNDMGTCNAKGLCESSDGILYDYKGTIFLKSATKTCGGEAANWCAQKGYTLVSLADTGITGGYENTCSCSKDSCIGADWHTLMGSFPDVAATAKTDQNGNRWWTADICNENALYINLPTKSLALHGLSACDYHPMCKVGNIASCPDGTSRNDVGNCE